MADEEKKSILPYALRFYSGNQNINHRISFIQSMKSVDHEKRSECIHYASQLISRNLNPGDMLYFIDEVYRIEPLKREYVTGWAKQFIVDNMDSANLCQLMRSIGHIQQESAESILPIALQIIRDGVNIDGCNRIIYALNFIPPGERLQRVNRAIEEMVNFEPNSPFYMGRFAEILEAPLNQEIPALNANLRELAMQGAGDVNVHHGDREHKTAQAIRLLKEHQGSVSSEYISESFNSLMDCIRALPSDDRKKHIMWVLGIEKVPAQNNSFGGFLRDYTSRYLENMKPQEFLGRLWFFIEQIDDKADKKNAQDSLFASLADGVEQDGTVVCDPGKIQRIIIGVLQGRLDGVNIDGDVIDESMDAEDSTAVVILNDNIKQAMDVLMLEAIKTEGVVNSEKVLKLIDSDVGLSKAKIDACRAYMAHRSAQRGALILTPVFTADYKTIELMKEALNAYLRDNPHVANDDFLKAVLQYDMEEKFKLGFET